MEDSTFTQEDIEQNKVISLLAYILFFIPLLAAKDSAFAKFHANQGLVLLLLGISISIVASVIPIIGWFIIGPFGTIFVIVLAIIGIINALNGKAKPLPLIGGITILK
jgi:uncharacterized membrane protein